MEEKLTLLPKILSTSFPTMEFSLKTFTFFNTPPPFFPPISSPFLLKSFCSSSPISTHRLELAESLQAETLQTLEWPSLCNQLSSFTSTTMAFSAARTARIPLGTTPNESRKLLSQTTAAVAFPHPVDFSGVQDVMEILESAVSGQLLSIREICAVRKTLVSAKGLFQQLNRISLDSNDPNRYSPLLEILQDCNFLSELEQKIGFCIDCKFSMILDQASEELEIIRSERKKNMENLESLLKELSVKIFQAGGIDRPLVTRRRSRLCVAVMANRRSLLPDGVVLSHSSSGATYFMEPKEAVDLNNIEVMLSDAEDAEVQAILSFLCSEIAKSITEINYLLDRIVDLDFAFARAAHARWINGVCPTMNFDYAKDRKLNDYESLSIDIEGIQHPLLLEASLRSLSDFALSSTRSPIPWQEENEAMDTNIFSGAPTFPVPIDVKVKYGTRVVVISGPNTGGKTASMKTLGLASVMLKAGMYIPARNNPNLPWFDLILADIGDHQSLEQSLSTFSGHLSRIRNILEVASEKSLVLMDEIGGGTDPSEGVALSTSILQYLKERVNLAVVTTHYADLSLLKEKDARFENAAMEFSLETLRPTYRVLWGSTGESNALSIAKSIGFDENIVERAQIWVGRLMPDKAEKRRDFLYESLIVERDKLEEQANIAASLYSDTKNIYEEILEEADDLPGREEALKAKETEQIQKETNAVKSQIATVVENFEKRIQTASVNQYNILLKEAGSEIASIVGAHLSTNDLPVRQANSPSYTPKVGDQVLVNGLGNKLATIVDAPGGDYVFVQFANDRFRVELNSIRPPPRSSSKSTTAGSSSRFRMQGKGPKS